MQLLDSIIFFVILSSYLLILFSIFTIVRVKPLEVAKAKGDLGLTRLFCYLLKTM
ncbi:hypothetical protein FX988_00602 [Paraglaciecola mesophila]|uniref:Uncharacterized protein n=1 Tax=Paraglaciecola mesophila TaxID=197222 RepID=A0A857JGT6_9ALTE|nr:hypothetical protein FX988_00602 [Paraglaciecola mesophila]